MTKHEVFNIWADEQSVWSRWVKPVLFASMPASMDLQEWELPSLAVSFPFERALGLVIDLPGAESVEAGMAAAMAGYRPVPLFNALPAPAGASLQIGGYAAIDTRRIISALVYYAERLKQLEMSPDAPPAFLLDAQRRGNGTMPGPGEFDNRSVSFTTDFPSATYLLGQGVGRMMLVQRERCLPQPDLAHTLLKWQLAGIELLSTATNGTLPPAPLEVPRPISFGRMWQRALAGLGFRRNYLGGFGGIVPEASSG